MKRFVSVWLMNFAIERLRRASRGDRVIGVDGASGPEGGGGAASKPAACAARAFALVASGPRGVVICAVNRSARRAGVQVGQTLADARAIHPSLMTRPAEPDADDKALRDIAVWAGRYGPNRNREGEDGIWIEISGVGHLFGGEEGLAQDLHGRLARAGFSARIAIADTPGAAYALARYGVRPGAYITISPPGECAQTLGQLPVDGLRLSDDAARLLKRLGLRTIGQVMAIPRAALARRFREETRAGHGRDGRKGGMGVRAQLAHAVVWRLDQALGKVSEPRAAIEEPPVRQVSWPFMEPLISTEGILAALDDLCVRLGTVLREAGEGARSLRLCLYRSDGSRAVVEAGASAPVHDAEHIASLFRDRLETIDAGMGIDLMALEAVSVEATSATQSALAAPGRHGGDINHLIDRISNRLGAERVLRLCPFASHLPERAERRTAALEHSSSKASALQQDPALRSNESTGPRPAFLLTHPEPIAVIAEMPEGAPARFSWRRITRRVAKSSGPERIAPEWWRHLSTAHARARQSDHGDNADGARVRLPRTRDYYVLEDEVGGRYWVFRDGIYTNACEAEGGAPTWYMHGLFG